MAKQISGYTKTVCILASPVEHSLSPSMHNAAYEKLGLDYVYLAYEVGVEQLGDAVKGMRALGIRGANISMPNKQAVMGYLDEISPSAQLIGAVNTVVNQDGQGYLVGHNTDGIGAMESLREEGVVITDQIITLAGIGGAGRAIAVQAALDGAKEIRIFNNEGKNFEAAKDLVDKLNQMTNCAVSLTDLQNQVHFHQSIQESTIFINATGVGMKPLASESLIETDGIIHSKLIVYDIIYTPRETKLLAFAKEQGARKTINGLGMILHQGAAAFRLITGKEMPVNYIRKLVFQDK